MLKRAARIKENSQANSADKYGKESRSLAQTKMCERKKKGGLDLPFRTL